MSYKMIHNLQKLMKEIWAGDILYFAHDEIVLDEFWVDNLMNF